MHYGARAIVARSREKHFYYIHLDVGFIHGDA